MLNKYLNLSSELRSKLHNMAEESMHEYKTKEALINFLNNETSLEIRDMGSWFYVKHTINSNEPYIAFRSDFDAVTGEDGISRHLCGHDGHASILAAFAKWVSDNNPNTNIILLFQHAEEIGAGAKECKSIFEIENISEIYGYHNIPGYDLGQILLIDGTFACGSVGYEIQFIGKPAHAAYPESGINPSKAISELILAIQEYIEQDHKGIVLSTVVGIESGSNHFGVSASEGIVRLTLRAELSDEFDQLLYFVKNIVDNLSKTYLLETSISEFDYFPATENHKDCINKVLNAASHAGLNTINSGEPFRWSEDFGWYLQECKGAYFGIGAGINHPQIHTENYEFNDNISSYLLKLLIELIIER